MGRPGDLEIEEDLQYQEREWTVQRVGWVLLAVFVGLAVAGLFGNGPISWTTAAAADGAIEVTYERFGRRGGPQEMTVKAPAATADDGAWVITFSRGYIAAFEVSAVTPQPDSVEAAGEAVRYTFLQAEPSADLDAIFAVRPRRLWSQSGEVGLQEGPSVRVTQFFFP